MGALVAVPRHTGLGRGWSTPQILGRGRIALMVLELLLLGAVVAGTQVQRSVLEHVGRGTAPGVMAAEKIRTELAGMDAAAVDSLLNPGDSKASGEFDAHRRQAAEAIVHAAGNEVALGLPQGPLDTLQVVMGTYERLVGEAVDLQDSGQEAMAVRYYRAAGIVMDGTLLPAAAELDGDNDRLLESRFRRDSTESFVWGAVVLLLGLGTAGALVVAQVFLSRRMQRTLNPMLLGATVLTLAMTLGSFGAMNRAGSELRLAKEDAFGSIRTLLRARAIAYSANSDESRYLLDTAHLGEAEKDFSGKVATLARLPAGETLEEVLASVRDGKRVDGFTGLLADELNGQLFPGERDAAIDAVSALAVYEGIDGKIRGLERSGNHAAAVALDTGRQEGESNWAFDRLDAALADAIGINQGEFDRAVAGGLEALGRVEAETGIAMAVCGLLIFFGFAPRIREYV